MRTNTEQYEATHGRKPKGKGTWIFELMGTDGNGAFLRETITSRGSLADAKKFAVKEFKSLSGRIKSVIEIEVLP